MKIVYWVQLQIGDSGYLWQNIGIYRRKHFAIRKAEAHRDQGRVQIREMQPCGPVIYDSQPEG